MRSVPSNKRHRITSRKDLVEPRLAALFASQQMELAASVPLDERENPDARVRDLSGELIVDYLVEVCSDLAQDAEQLPLVSLGRRMGIIGGPPEAPCPTNAGLLFFHPEPWRFFPAAQINVIWGPVGNRSTQSFRGPLHQMTRDALHYIDTCFMPATVIKRAGRAEADRLKNYPLEAVEEALVNAVYHRGYDVPVPIEVSITPDHLTVRSYPGPDRALKQHDFNASRSVSRRCRNRRIGELLKELGFIEGRCTGISKIRRAMRKNSSPPPVFQLDEQHSYFAAILPVHPEARATAPGWMGCRS